jgi:GNAT superfamily N-acetyltransferase
MIIKTPRPDELDSTIILMEYYRDEARLPEGEYDGDAMAETIKNYMVHHDHCWFNAYDNGRPVGLIAGYVTEIPWSRRLMAHVQFIYTLPSHRNLELALKLIRHFEDWSRNLGAVKLSAGDIGINAERTRALYQQAGFIDTGCWLSKELAQ